MPKTNKAKTSKTSSARSKKKCPECGRVFDSEEGHRKEHHLEIGKGYRVADLFAGIGGFHLAFHEVGCKCVFSSEWDEYARKTYEENFYDLNPDLFESGNFKGDIKKIDTNDAPDFDILTAGFPCQPFSQAGDSEGFEDTRGNAFFHLAEIIASKKPDVFLLENVRNLMNVEAGKTFELIRHVLEDQLGYSFEYKIIKASDFGLPQRRPRLFMVGFKSQKAASFFEFPEERGLQKTMSDIFQGKCEREIGYTLRVGGRGSGIDDRRNWDAYRVDGEVVKLGPKEGKEMMGLPEWFTFPVSETQTMKQLGNSVAVTVVKAIAKNIVTTLNKYDE